MGIKWFAHLYVTEKRITNQKNARFFHMGSMLLACNGGGCLYVDMIGLGCLGID